MSQQKLTPLPPDYAAKRVFSRLIKRASSVSSTLSVTEEPNLTLESCLEQHGAYSTGIPPDDSRLVDLSDIELQSQFLDCATVMYTMRVGLPAHPDYPRFTADPQVRTKLDATARELFERLQDLKLEVLKRASVTDPKHQLEMETAWIGLKRHLRFENGAETIAKEGIQTPLEGSDVQAYTDLLVPINIPDEPPSPRSYWIDLHPIEDTGHEGGFIPEESPVPLSYWINLRPIEDHGGLVPEAAPEPTSVFLELHPLGDSSAPEIPPSPAELTLEL